ncbi:HD domain-containing protein [Candidatus Dojkabacteria bacterium]|nr:HD domain-containing protein [Candidatus Dojkabacteria bacterium]
MNDAASLINSIVFLNKFKHVQRLSLISKEGRRETDAEHTWHLVMTIWMLSEKYEKKIDLNKAIKMALVHDLVEIIAGDVYAHSTEVSKEQKRMNEINAMKEIVPQLPIRFGKEVRELWEEYEERSSEEAKFVWLTDKIMPRIIYKLTEGDSTDDMESDTTHDQEQIKKIRGMSKLFSELLDEIYN